MEDNVDEKPMSDKKVNCDPDNIVVSYDWKQVNVPDCHYWCRQDCYQGYKYLQEEDDDEKGLSIKR